MDGGPAQDVPRPTEPLLGGVRVLVVEAPGSPAPACDLLAGAAVEAARVTCVTGLAEAVHRLTREGADVVLLDADLPDGRGLEALTQVRTAALDAPVVLLTSDPGDDVARDALREGAQDVLVKDAVDAAGLARAMACAIERSRLQSDLAHQALHDPLTGLPNRALFCDRLLQAVSRLQRSGVCVAVLFCDLDGFKAVNDSLGHEAGDRLLVEVAGRLDRVLRAGDTAARFGGDEFCVLLEEVRDADHAVDVARRVLDELQAPLRIDGEPVALRASMGVAVGLGGGVTDTDVLLRDADAAMYRAKERGGGVAELFGARLRARGARRLGTAEALRRALRRGELRVHYQPRLGLVTRTVVAMEALVRWQHPRRGLVGPREFLAVAEETGLILDVGTWALEQACRQTAWWNERRPVLDPVIVAVNLSARQAADPQLVERVRAAVQASGVDPATMCLEVGEAAVSADLDAHVATLEALRALGLELALDDFGSGLWSLAALSRCPVDVVTLDRGLVGAIEHDERTAAIVEAVVGLAHGMGMRTVAEGVEGPGQAARLQALGCDDAQGFHFAPPAAPERLATLLGVD